MRLPGHFPATLPTASYVAAPLVGPLLVLVLVLVSSALLAAAVHAQANPVPAPNSEDHGATGTIENHTAQVAELERLLAHDDYQGVVASAHALLRETPESFAASRLMGFALRELGEYRLASTALEAALAARVKAGKPYPGLDSGPAAFDVQAALAELDLQANRRNAAAARAEAILASYAKSGHALSPADYDGAARAARLLARKDPGQFQIALQIYETGLAEHPGSLTLRIALGDLLLEKYNNEEARELYLTALESNAEDPRALLAMARSESFNESPEAGKLASAALAHRPGWVQARQVLARIHLNNHDFDSAQAEIEASLKINPNSAHTRGLQGALALLRADDEAVAAAIDASVRAAPGDVRVFEILAEVAVRNRLYPYAVEFARQAVSSDPEAWKSYGLLGLNQLRIGAIRAGHRNLRHAFARDPYNIWVKNTLDLLDRMADFEQFVSEHFILIADPEEGRVLAPLMLPIAEAAYQHYAQRYGHEPPTPIRIEVFQNHEDFSVRTVGLVGVDILGASFGPVIAMDSPSTGAFGPINWASVIWHEISHTFHLSMSRYRVPRWFTEGLAVLEEHQARPGWGGDVSPGFLIAFRRGELPAASELEKAFQRPATSEQVSHYYYLSYLLAEFIERQHGAEAIVRMLEGYAQGRSVTDMVGAVTGLYGAGLDGALERHIRLRFGPSIDALTPLVDLAEISADEAANPYEVTYKGAIVALRTGQTEAAEITFRRAIQLFPEYAGPDSSYHQLAKLYLASGRSEEARQVLETIVAINADDEQAQRDLTDLLLAAGEEEAAIDALERLQRIDPFNPARHKQLAQFYESRDQWFHVARARAAVLDLGPADRAGAHYELARALVRAGNPDAGREHVLRALEIAPLFDDGLELLLEIRDQLSQ